MFRRLKEAGLRGRIRLRSDGEPAIVQVLEELCRLRGSEITLQEQLTRNEPSSVGAVGRLGQSQTAMVRTIVMDLEQRFGEKIDAAHNLFPWCVRHAAWVINRFQAHKKLNNQTSFEVRAGRVYSSPVYAI